MIAQVLNRKFVLEILWSVRDDLERDLEEATAARRGVDETVEPQELQTAFEELTAALRREQAASSGQRAFEPPPAGRRGEWAGLDDYSFFSRDPVISIAQSVLDEYFGTHPTDGLQETPPSDDEQHDESGVAVVTGRSLTTPPQRDLEGRRLFGAFEVTDPRWISSGIAMGLRLFRGRFKPFNTRPAEPAPMADNARLILAADWGTGIPRATRVGEQMRKYAQLGDRETHVIHLGDVYYSGFKREYEKRFLPFWPVLSGEENRIGSWCVNGNHDMYSGGHAYFKDLLTEPRFRRQNACSYFRLQTSKWDIFGLDSGYEDGGLEAPQVDWVLERIGNSPRKAMLLTHHQFFSGFEEVNQKMVGKLHRVADTGRVRAWFWGHEHRSLVYKREVKKIGYAACIGHGGVPVYMNRTPADPFPTDVEFEYRKFIQKGAEKWAMLGFVVLEFNGDKVHAIYVDEAGARYREDDFE
jgi:calcineurin-like phosphoesterase family protein